MNNMQRKHLNFLNTNVDGDTDITQMKEILTNNINELTDDNNVKTRIIEQLFLIISDTQIRTLLNIWSIVINDVKNKFKNGISIDAFVDYIFNYLIKYIDKQKVNEKTKLKNINENKTKNKTSFKNNINILSVGLNKLIKVINTTIEIFINLTNAINNDYQDILIKKGRDSKTKINNYEHDYNTIKTSIKNLNILSRNLLNSNNVNDLTNIENTFFNILNFKLLNDYAINLKFSVGKQYTPKAIIYLKNNFSKNVTKIINDINK